MIVAQDIDISTQNKKLVSPLDLETHPLKLIDHELSDLIQVNLEGIEKMDKKRLKDLIEFYGLKDFISVFEVKDDTLDKISKRFKDDPRIMEIMNQYLESTDCNQNSKELRNSLVYSKKVMGRIMEEESSSFDFKPNIEKPLEKTQRDVLIEQIDKMRGSMKQKLKMRQRIPSMFRYQLDTSRGGDSSISHSNRISIDKNYQKLDFSNFSKAINDIQNPSSRSKTTRPAINKIEEVEERNSSSKKKRKMRLKVKKLNPKETSKGGFLFGMLQGLNEDNSIDKRNKSYFGKKLHKIKSSNHEERKRLRTNIKEKIENIKKSRTRINKITDRAKPKKIKRESKSTNKLEAIDVKELKYPKNPEYRKKGQRYSLDEEERRKIFKDREGGSASDRNILKKSMENPRNPITNFYFSSNDKSVEIVNENKVIRNFSKNFNNEAVKSTSRIRENSSQGQLLQKPEDERQNNDFRGSYTTRNKIISTSRNRVYGNFEEKPVRNSLDILSTNMRNQVYLSNEFNPENKTTKTKKENLLFYSNNDQNFLKIPSRDRGSENFNTQETPINKTSISYQTSKLNNSENPPFRNNNSNSNLPLNNSGVLIGPTKTPRSVNTWKIQMGGNLKEKVTLNQQNNVIKRVEARINNPNHRRQFSADRGDIIAHSNNFNTSNTSFKQDTSAWDLNNSKSPHRVKNLNIDIKTIEGVLIQRDKNDIVSSSLQFSSTAENEVQKMSFFDKKKSNDINYVLKQKLSNRGRIDSVKLNSIFGEKMKIKNSFIGNSSIMGGPLNSSNQVISDHFGNQTNRDYPQSSRNYININSQSSNLNYQNTQVNYLEHNERNKSFHKSPSYPKNVNSSGMETAPQTFTNYNTINKGITPTNVQNFSSNIGNYNSQNIASSNKNITYRSYNSGENNFQMGGGGFNFSNTPKTLGNDFFKSNIQGSFEGQVRGKRESFVPSDGQNRGVKVKQGGEPVRIVGYLGKQEKTG